MARKSKKSPPKTAIEASVSAAPTKRTYNKAKANEVKAATTKASVRTPTTPKAPPKPRQPRQPKKTTKINAETTKLEPTTSTRPAKARKSSTSATAVALSDIPEIDLTNSSPIPDDGSGALPPLALLTSSKIHETSSSVIVTQPVDIADDNLNQPELSTIVSAANDVSIPIKPTQPPKSEEVIDQSTPKTVKSKAPAAKIVQAPATSKCLFNNFVIEENFSPIRHLRSNYLVNQKDLAVYYGDEAEEDEDEDHIVPKLNHQIPKTDQSEPVSGDPKSIVNNETTPTKKNTISKKNKKKKRKLQLKQQFDLKQVLDKFDLEIQKSSQQEDSFVSGNGVAVAPTETPAESVSVTTTNGHTEKSPELDLMDDDDDDDFDEIIADVGVNRVSPVAIASIATNGITQLPNPPQTQQQLNEEDFFGCDEDDDDFGSFIDKLPESKTQIPIESKKLLAPQNQSTPLLVDRFKRFSTITESESNNRIVQCSTPNFNVQTTNIGKSTIGSKLGALSAIRPLKPTTIDSGGLVGKQLDFSLIDDDEDIDVDELIISKIEPATATKKKTPLEDDGTLVTIQLKRLKSTTIDGDVRTAKLMSMTNLLQLIERNC